MTSEPESEARSPEPAERRLDVAAVLGLSVLWGIPLSVIGVSGDFPLNDDWAYARAALRLIETGLIERTSWSWVPLISHSYFGAFAAWLTAPALTVLEAFRCVGVVMGWLGMLGTYALCRQVGARALPAAVAAAVVALNPVYLNLSYTFMTDVPVAAMCAWSLCFLARGARNESWTWVLAGALVALLAALARQTGMALPMAFAAAVVVSSPIPTFSWARALVAGAIVGFGYLAGLEVAYGPEDPSTLFRVADMGLERFPFFHLVKNTVVSLVYLGCFLGPVTVISGKGSLPRRGWTIALATGFVMAGVATVFRLQLAMPPGLNVIYNLGLGPHWLDGRVTLPVTGDAVWWVLTALGLLGIFVAGARIAIGSLTRFWEVWQRPDWLLLLAFPAIFIFPHLFRSPYFDRYLLPILAPLAAALLVLPRWSGRPGRGPLVAAAAVLLLFLGYGTAGTRDYIVRQRTSWALLEQLTASGISPHRIDGGFEFNGLHSFERQVLPDDIIWEYVNDDEFKLSHFERIEGYELLASKSFSRLLPPSTETIRLFRRLPPGRAPSR